MGKKTIAVFCLPFYGHVHPLSGIVKELVHKGYNLVVYSTEGLESEYASDLFKKLGADYKTIGSYGSWFSPDIGHDALKAADLILKIVDDALPTILSELDKDKPDLIIHDAYCTWAKVAAKVRAVPAVSVLTTFVLTPLLSISYPNIVYSQALKVIKKLPTYLNVQKKHMELNRKYHLGAPNVFDLFLNEEQLNIILTSKELQPFGETFPDSYIFIGPSVDARREGREEIHAFKNEQPLIYISLGTIFNTDTAFYELCRDAFTGEPYNVIISAGKSVEIDRSSFPENIFIAPHVDQIGVLQKASLFITHAGMNSVHEALYYKVQMVLMPVIPEQKINASRVSEVGAGKLLVREGLTVHRLREVVTEVLEEGSYRSSVNRISETLHNAGGVPLAVKRIEALL